ncbi:hypothetical protein HK102_006408, partial [Quaeritorhiza haematococci]
MPPLHSEPELRHQSLISNNSNSATTSSSASSTSSSSNTINCNTFEQEPSSRFPSTSTPHSSASVLIPKNLLAPAAEKHSPAPTTTMTPALSPPSPSPPATSSTTSNTSQQGPRKTARPGAQPTTILEPRLSLIHVSRSELTLSSNLSPTPPTPSTTTTTNNNNNTDSQQQSQQDALSCRLQSSLSLRDSTPSTSSPSSTSSDDDGDETVTTLLQYSIHRPGRHLLRELALVFPFLKKPSPSSTAASAAAPPTDPVTDTRETRTLDDLLVIPTFQRSQHDL